MDNNKGDTRYRIFKEDYYEEKTYGTSACCVYGCRSDSMWR